MSWGSTLDSTAWFTFGAQILNFLVLVALLKKFLYGRVIGAMEARERRIAAQLEEAEMRTREAEQEAERLRQLQGEWQAEQDERRRALQSELAEQRALLLDEARQEAERRRDEWGTAMDRQRDQLALALRRDAVEQAQTLATRLLEQLADESLEQKVIDRFLAELRELPPDRRDGLLPPDPVVVRTAFVLTPSRQEEVSAEIRTLLAAPGDIVFRTSTDLVCGIELEARGWKLGWSLRESLETLEREIDDLLERELPRPAPRDLAEAAAQETT